MSAPSPPPAPHANDPWGALWASGAAAAVEGPAATALAAFWRAVFGGCAAGTAVLDLGTGAGAVLAHAAQTGKGLALTGVDAAAVPPSPAGMTLRGGVAMEALPFPDGCFDRVCGQFALEYAAPEPAVAEALRVLRPQGRFAFALHAAEGALAAHNRASRAHLQRLLDSPLPTAMAALIEAIAAAPTDGPLPDPLRAAITEAGAAAQALEAELRDAPSAALAHTALARLRGVHAAGATTAARRAALADLTERIAAQITRLAALQAAALEAEGVASLAGRFQRLGAADVAFGPIHEAAGGRQIAWRLEGRGAA